jgi:hypothetical protein
MNIFGPSLTGLRGTQVTGSISYTLVRHQVDPWKGRYSSVAARLILSNSSLAGLPTYCMGLFLLAEGTHAGFDKLLARFFWEGVGHKRKYHWLRWDDCCVPKALGRLGLTNTRALNLALMLKWVWRMYNLVTIIPSSSDFLLQSTPNRSTFLIQEARAAPSFGKVSLGLSICLGWAPISMFKMVRPLGFG